MTEEKIQPARKKLLCLDLDNTLIYASSKPFANYQVIVDGDFMAVRPGLTEFLDRMEPSFDFMIWSISGEKYVKAMLNVMWPKEHELKAIYTGEQARLRIEQGQGIPTYKDLHKIYRRLPYDKSQIIALDDRPISYARSYGNLVQIQPFFGDPGDNEFEKVGNLLENLANVPNVRTIEKRWFKMAPEMYARKNPQGSGESSLEG